MDTVPNKDLYAQADVTYSAATQHKNQTKRSKGEIRVEQYTLTLTRRDQLVARANSLVFAAIKRGLLPELETAFCMDCGAAAECYDHRNYYHPLAVDPVCKGCNNRRGPGFPPLTKEDGAFRKHGLEGVAGYRWSSLEGQGEGFCVPECRVLAGVDWRAVEEAQDLDDDIVRNRMSYAKKTWQVKFGGQTLALGGSAGFRAPHGLWRAEYFKARDPWAIT